MFESILLYPRLNSKYYSIQKNSADSIQKIIQFNSKGVIDTGQIGKVPSIPSILSSPSSLVYGAVLPHSLMKIVLKEYTFDWFMQDIIVVYFR